MSRELKRVPLDFNWPLNKIWQGFQNPHYDGHCKNCPACKGSGYSPQAQILAGKWYGHDVPFHPSETGSIPFNFDHPVVMEAARRNCLHSPSFYGNSMAAIEREARRLAEHFNSGWVHHLDTEDVAALLESGRLMDFTRTEYTPTPAEVNAWSLIGMGHDAINRSICVRAKCKRLGYPELCAVCEGHGSIWDSPENKVIAEAWERQEPPTGEGWQLWEDVSEGSPISPVFATRDEFAQYLCDEGYSEKAIDGFIEKGHAFSMVMTGGKIYNDIESCALP